MSNSSLSNFTLISPNSSNPRNKPISIITIHHMAGDLTVEKCGSIFKSKARQASANYGIDNKGHIGLYVDEHNRPWTSSNAENDNKAITIEVANNSGGPKWTISDTALKTLIKLCVDICKRNHIKSLKYTGDTKGNLTTHNMFKATICPGTYLESKLPYIVKQVNTNLAKPAAPKAKPSTVSTITKLAKETLAGKYGNGSYRVKALGKDYNAVQAIINKTKAKPSTVSTITKLAKETIAGKYGNGSDRVKALGKDYKAVQAMVNKMMK